MRVRAIQYHHMTQGGGEPGGRGGGQKQAKKVSVCSQYTYNCNCAESVINKFKNLLDRKVIVVQRCSLSEGPQRELYIFYDRQMHSKLSHFRCQLILKKSSNTQYFLMLLNIQPKIMVLINCQKWLLQKILKNSMWDHVTILYFNCLLRCLLTTLTGLS